jgi:PAS domain S-box-containing protein
VREVSTQTIALVLDGLAHRALDPAPFLEGTGVDVATLRDPLTRVDWDVWVTLLDRIQDRIGGPSEMEHLFVPRAGERTRHPFVALGRSFLGIDDLYRLLVRWGMQRQLRVIQARFERIDATHARVTMSIDERATASEATFRFTAGIMRALPGLQGLPHATVRARYAPRHVVFDLDLPTRPSFLARARLVARFMGGADATLDELAQQSREIHEKNLELEDRVADLAKAEAELRERDEWLALALEAGRVGTWTMDDATSPPRASPGFFRLLGLDPAVATPEQAFERYHPDDRASVRASLDELLSGGRDMELEVRARDRSDVPIWLRITGRRVGTRFVGTVVDVTERHALEARLRLADRLAAVGTLAAGVAHEINNPLTYVMGNAELLRHELPALAAEGARLDEQLEEMLEGLGRIRQVVRDLRTFARPQDDVVARVSLGAVVSAALRLVGHQLRHRARVIYVPPAEDLVVIGNEARLGQVLTNLLINAAHATRHRPAEDALVSVSLARRGAETVTEVRDNGTGIPREQLERIFDPFYTTKEVGEGTGLGLSVCQGIVQGLGGRIEVDSEVGAGSTFRVILPTAPPSRTASTEGGPAPGPIARRVLLVDDEPLVRRTVARMLRAEGCEVMEAEGGRDALEKARAASFDVILCDLMMPDVHGVDVYRALESTSPAAAERVVFLSGGAVTPDVQAFLAACPRPCLEKPFRMDDLRRLVAS